MQTDNIRVHYGSGQTKMLDAASLMHRSGFFVPEKIYRKETLWRFECIGATAPKDFPLQAGYPSIQGYGNTLPLLSNRICPDQIPYSNQSTESECYGNAANHRSQFSTSMPQARWLSGCPDQRFVSLRKNPSCRPASGKAHKAACRSRKMPCIAYTGRDGPEEGKRLLSFRNTKIGRLEPALSRKQGKCR